MPKERPDYELGPEQEKMYEVFDKLDHEIKTANNYLKSKDAVLRAEAQRLVNAQRGLRSEDTPDLKRLYDIATDLIEFDRLDDYRVSEAKLREQFAEIIEDRKDSIAANERIKARRLKKMESGGEFWDKVSYGTARAGNLIFSGVGSYGLLKHYAEGYEEFAIAVLGGALVWGEYAVSKWKDKKKKKIDIDYTSHQKRIKSEARERRAEASEWLSSKKHTINTKTQKKRRVIYKICFDKELPGDIAADENEKMEERFMLEDRPMERALEQPEPGPKAMLARARSYQRRLKKEVGDKDDKNED